MNYHYVAWDPGETTGVACWDAKPERICINQFRLPELDNFLLTELEPNPPKVFIIEGYQVFGHKAEAHIGSKLETSQIIGALKYFARRYKIEIIEQSSHILKVAQKFSGVKIPTDHKISHWASAYNHGYYYLHNKGLIKPRVLEDKE